MTDKLGKKLSDAQKYLGIHGSPSAQRFMEEMGRSRAYMKDIVAYNEHMDVIQVRLREMTSEAVRQQEMVRKALAPIEEVRKAEERLRATLGPNLEGLRAILHPQEEALRTAIGPHLETLRAATRPLDDASHMMQLEQAKHAADLLRANSALQLQIDHAAKSFLEYEAKFKLPEIDTAARLLRELEYSPKIDAFRAMVLESATIKQAMEAMRSPWLKAAEEMRSATAFAQLQGIGRALSAVPTFDSHLAGVLRDNLGDWRDSISWPEPIFTEIGARSDFYEARGFDPALTDFPPTAFEDSLDIARLRECPAIVEAYGLPVPRSDDEEGEASLMRTNSGHDWLQRLESRLRTFIDGMMTQAFGPNWPRHRLPNGLYEQWQEKQKQEKDRSGRDWPLICFADFTDYEKVICRKDNWREVFEAFFKRPEFVRESFQRLYPIRVCTMHARLISQDDELFLYVEVKRLVMAIGWHPPKRM